MSRVRTHFCTLAARGQGAWASPVRYGLNGTMPALTNSGVGSGVGSGALGTTVWPRSAKWLRKRRRISAVRKAGLRGYRGRAASDRAGWWGPRKTTMPFPSVEGWVAWVQPRRR